MQTKYESYEFDSLGKLKTIEGSKIYDMMLARHGKQPLHKWQKKKHLIGELVTNNQSFFDTDLGTIDKTEMIKPE